MPAAGVRRYRRLVAVCIVGVIGSDRGGVIAGLSGTPPDGNPHPVHPASPTPNNPPASVTKSTEFPSWRATK